MSVCMARLSTPNGASRMTLSVIGFEMQPDGNERQ